MVGVLSVLRHLLAPGTSDAAMLLAMIPSGAACYSAAAWMFAPAHVSEAIAVARVFLKH
jgi:hypothetical protein